MCLGPGKYFCVDGDLGKVGRQTYSTYEEAEKLWPKMRIDWEARARVRKRLKARGPVRS